jgi:murein DD-endopeptidase MepM/ murein hydrolase activator NlpD
VDLAAPRGTPVHAVADGRVEFAGVQHGYGNVVYVQHADGRDTTVYGHLSRIDVKMNQRITRGEQIGTVGSTGIATGPHLHFELRVNGSPINPSPVLAEAQTDTAVPGVSRAAFAEQSAAMLGQLAIADQLRPGGFE